MKKILYPVIALPTLCFSLVSYDAYRNSSKPSIYENASYKLGFKGYEKNGTQISRAEHQDALLRQLQIAGYLKPENIWRDINQIGIQKPEILFKDLYKIVKKTNADSENPSDFNAKLFRKNFGKNSHITESEMMDFLLYIAQNAFEREQGQERNELSKKSWIQKYSEEFKTNSTILGLIDAQNPTLTKYEGAWIMGASRPGLLARLIDYDYNINKYHININGNIMILAGQRELWANIDGIDPNLLAILNKSFNEKMGLNHIDTQSLNAIESVQEGREYMLQLAKNNNIKYNLSQPFVEYKTQAECPSGYFPNRVYMNYDKSETQKLTETLMSLDLQKTYLPNATKLLIIDTSLDKDKRPTTSTTSKDAAEKFIEDIISGKYGEQKEFAILVQTNNPYIERQALSAQRAVNQVIKDKGLDPNIYKIKVYGTGFETKQDLSVVHSEFAALMAEKWKIAVEENDSTNTHRSIEGLSFQTRQKYKMEIPEMPTIEDSVNTNYLQDFFDYYTE
ncbi:MAG: hypothetical protein SFT68_03070 [Rickettsiaceae bacterium]|nr:hypothetical protein [Rickettsiaceae bacterium]